ncbi:entericidin A/B family lipoprotein [Rosenbergiella sp. S61]|uniref:Entericidin A/B family lipoprotein n=1 Tax=Rosenbergiella gaditana TaxID=2726987 RepID=A0ABS5SW42_9GAMM|nr:entericidin A/B family lipoprotein [Rosenbergiella gaditana]MBT0724122.1 entericidin A/B family lipoprotein [Rosenbergiella gaditana]
MKSLVIRVAILFLFSVSLTACNTFRGMGEDVSSLGHAISHVAS